MVAVEVWLVRRDHVCGIFPKSISYGRKG